MVSPFLGGGAVELNLALRGIQVYGYDADTHLVNFWQQWLRNHADIRADTQKIMRRYDRDALVALRANFEKIDGAKNRALLYYIFNRLAFGGKTLHDKGYLKKFHEHKGIFYRDDGTRLFPNTDFWDRVEGLPLEVGLADFSESLSRHPSIFAYVDPPYYEVGKRLYLTSQRGFDHERLAAVLKGIDNWILSYNDSVVIRSLYAEYERIAMVGRNFSTNRKTSTELLIFSHDIGEQLEYQQELLF